MSFLRHHEIYRSDVGIKTILGLGPCTASRWPAPSHEKGRGFNPAPFPSSAMSLGSAIPWQVALQQCPPPLHRPESMLYPPAETVNHHLTGAGEFSTGTLGNFQPVLTNGPQNVPDLSGIVILNRPLITICRGGPRAANQQSGGGRPLERVAIAAM